MMLAVVKSMLNRIYILSKVHAEKIIYSAWGIWWNTTYVSHIRSNARWVVTKSVQQNTFWQASSRSAVQKITFISGNRNIITIIICLLHCCVKHFGKAEISSVLRVNSKEGDICNISKCDVDIIAYRYILC